MFLLILKTVDRRLLEEQRKNSKATRWQDPFFIDRFASCESIFSISSKGMYGE